VYFVAPAVKNINKVNQFHKRLSFILIQIFVQSLISPLVIISITQRLITVNVIKFGKGTYRLFATKNENKQHLIMITDSVLGLFMTPINAIWLTLYRNFNQSVQEHRTKDFLKVTDVHKDDFTYIHKKMNKSSGKLENYHEIIE
jgi:hypothetical protein